MPATHLALARGDDQHEPLARRALKQMCERLRGGRVAPVGVVQHHVQGRLPGGVPECRADAAQQPVAGTLGRRDLAGAGRFRGSRVLAQLRHERRELWPGGPRQLAAPLIVADARELTDRAHPRLEGDARLGRASRQGHDRALRVGI